MSFSSVDDWIARKTGAEDSKALLKYQMQKVRETLRYVITRSTFYGRRLRDFHRDIGAIHELPFTYPEDIERYSPEMLCVSQAEINRIVTHITSGTTAPPKRIFFTEKDQEATIDFFHHGMMEFTSAGDKVLILFPGTKDGSIGRLLATGLERFGAVPLVYGIVSDYDDLLRFISNREINVITGLPQQLLELSILSLDRNIAVSGLHSVLLSADYSAKSLVSAIEKNLGCAVYDHYGMTETCFGGGVYSKIRDGYHLRHNDFLFEIVDPVTGSVLSPGEYGEIVFTSLNTEAMPLVRYRTGDIARFLPQTDKFPVLEKIMDRLKDRVPLPNGYILKMADLEEVFFDNTEILDFTASYNGNTLKLHVRSLRFDGEEIIKKLRDSQLETTLAYCNIEVSPLNSGNTSKNTMTKRTIIFRA